MSERVVADFVARFLPAHDGKTEPIRGRVVLSRTRLVLAESEGQTTRPLGGVVDVEIGQVPRELARFFDDALTIVYEREGRRRFAVVEDARGCAKRAWSPTERAQPNSLSRARPS